MEDVEAVGAAPRRLVILDPLAADQTLQRVAFDVLDELLALRNLRRFDGLFFLAARWSLRRFLVALRRLLLLLLLPRLVIPLLIPLIAIVVVLLFPHGVSRSMVTIVVPPAIEIILIVVVKLFVLG